MTHRPAHYLPTATALVVMLVLAWPTLAALTTVAGLFESGRYDDAREALAGGEEGHRPGEDILWRSRLETDPALALGLLESVATDDKLPDTVRLRAALEAADIEAGRGNHRDVLRILGPVLAKDSTAVPGAAHLRAGLALRALGQLQQAREMLASIRPNDPQFVLARFYLGDIALEQNDPPLAQRYFEAAAKAGTAGDRDRLAAGRWRAYMADGDEDKAENLYADLSGRDPGALPLLEIRRLRQVEADEHRARQAGTADDTESGSMSGSMSESALDRPVDLTGRYALQLGAFSDRGLALEFQRRYSSQLPDLRIDKTRDARGQFLYKVRTGSYVNPALARTDAAQLARRLGIDVIVAELTDTVGRGGN